MENLGNKLNTERVTSTFWLFGGIFFHFYLALKNHLRLEVSLFTQKMIRFMQRIDVMWMLKEIKSVWVAYT